MDMPKKLTNIKFNTDIKYSQSFSVASNSPPAYYSICQEKRDKEKEIIGLDRKIKLAVELLSKVTDTSQRYKLINKKKDCLEQKEFLMKIANELSYVYTVLNKCTIFFGFIKDFYSLFFELFISDSDPGFSICRKLNILKNREEVLINLADCKSYFKDDLEALNYSEHNPRLEAFIDNFFENFDKGFRANYFFKYMLFCEKIIDAFIEPIECMAKDRFNVNDLEFFFQKQFSTFPMPSAKHSLVGILAVFLHKTLFKFLSYRPIASNFEKIKQYIKFHKEILNFSMGEFILHDIFSIKKSIIKLENEADIFLGSKLEFSKSDVDKRLFFFNNSYKQLKIIKECLNNLFRNEKYLQNIKVLASVLKREKSQDLIRFLRDRTGLDQSLIMNPLSDFNIKVNKEIIKYFFSIICLEESRVSLFQAVENIISIIFKKYENNCIVVLEDLTTKDLLCLGYLSFSILLFQKFNAKLSDIENKLMRYKLLTIQVLIIVSLIEVDKNEKKLEVSEKEFFKKKYLNKEEFFHFKSNLLEEITFHLTYIQNFILFMEEERDLQWGFDDGASLDDISISIKSRKFSEFLDTDRSDLKAILNTLQIRKKQLILKNETIENYLLSESYELTIKNSNEKFSCSKELSLIEKSIESEVFYAPMACLSKDLLDIAQYIDQPEATISKYNKNTRKRNKFFSTVGRIRASINLITQKLNKLGANSSCSSNLTSMLESVKNTIVNAASEVDSDKRLGLLKKNIERCFSSIEGIEQQIITITEKYKSYNDEIEKLLIKNSFKCQATVSIFFHPHSELKKIDKLFKENYFNLKQKMCWLEEIIKLIGNNESPRIIEIYNVIFQAEEYEKIFNCLGQQNDALYIHSAPAIPDKSAQSIIGPENSKHPFKRRTAKLKQRKNLAINSKNPCAEEESYELIELNKLHEWNVGLEIWKRKRYFYLDNLFNTIEKCSFSILNKTAAIFLKILSYYEREFIDKKQELKHQQSKLNTFFQYPLSCVAPIKNFMVYYEQSFENVLARLSACTHYVLQSSEKYNFIIGNSFSANIFYAPYFSTNQVVNNLLADYLNYFIIYTKTKNRLILEESKLSDINGEFIEKMIQNNSLNGIEQEIDLLSKFNEKISEVNSLSYAIKEAQEQRQQAKEKLAQLIEPETLSFYLRRIDPSDTQILRDNLSSFFTSPSYVLNQSSFYFIPESLASVSVNSENYESNIGYHDVAQN